MGRTAVIDYGAGNLMSVTNALRYLGEEWIITSDKSEIEKSDRVILPGVGAFPAAMRYLREKGFESFVKEQAEKKPLLGICLGMQMLFEESDEIELTTGLGLIPGRIQRVPTELKLPHIGWNSLKFNNPCPLLKGVDEGAYVYFVHTFCAMTKYPENLIASADYGAEVAAIVSSGNVFGCQFHPEKSGEAGLAILKNFCTL
ncbi:MAG: imidazole glycerol phosphate synthase subunit HisH [Ruminococcaceae bacterium]|nr:imidazole glycerol phosphate synthase subunit HisH [Oscillospiraceae bacterium]